MRAVAGRLGSKPMSLYRHIANKEELLDALVERVYTEFELPDPKQPDWRGELRRAQVPCGSLVRHPWALALSRPAPGLTARSRSPMPKPSWRPWSEQGLADGSASLLTLDSYVYGFALQEITMASTIPRSG